MPPQTIIRDGEGGQTVSYKLPAGVFQYVQSVLVEVSNGAAGAVRPTLSVQTVNQVPLANKQLGEGIDAGANGTATWALGLTDAGASGAVTVGGFRILGPRTVTATSPLDTGVTLYTPAVGEMLYDVWIVVREAFADSSSDGRVMRLFIGGTQWTNPNNFNEYIDLNDTDDNSGAISQASTNNSPEQFTMGIAQVGDYGRQVAPVLLSAPLVARCDTFNRDGVTGIADIYVLAGVPVPFP